MNMIKKAVSYLQKGDVIAIPTETVYGLAADASNLLAVKKIFKLKQRPADHPVIVHIANESKLAEWAIDIPETAFQLTRAFWPGPLTLILKKAPHVFDIITGGQKTIGLRAPAHPITQKILQAFGGGVAAPSANRFGKLSPTTAQHVMDDFGDEISLIVDGGPCQIGIESTIVDLTSDIPRVLRPGMISPAQIKETLGISIALTDRNAPRVSGSLPAHYAPNTKTVLLDSTAIESLIKNTDKKLAILTTRHLNKPGVNIIVMPNKPDQYAKILYQTLHKLDQLNLDLIAIEKLPASLEWNAITDRLQRATYE